MNRSLVVGIVLILIGMLGLWFMWGGSGYWRRGPMGFGMMPWSGGPRVALKTDFASNGERIYYTGTSERTGQIPFRGGPMWLWVHGGSCVDCHGVDGRGGVPIMMGTEIPPDIRYTALTEEEHDAHGAEEAHPAYTETSIERAITLGVEPDGHELDWTMPRWQMNQEDLKDVVEYLKTLGAH